MRLPRSAAGRSLENPMNGSATAAILVDAPREQESIETRRFAFRVLADDARRVELALNQGPWLPCFSSAGYWWREWTELEPGEYELNARALGRDGRWVVAGRRRFSVASRTG